MSHNAGEACKFLYEETIAEMMQRIFRLLPHLLALVTFPASNTKVIYAQSHFVGTAFFTAGVQRKGRRECN